MIVHSKLYEVAADSNLRQSTVLSYERLLGQLGILDADEPSREEVMEAP